MRFQGLNEVCCVTGEVTSLTSNAIENPIVRHQWTFTQICRFTKGPQWSYHIYSPHFAQLQRLEMLSIRLKNSQRFRCVSIVGSSLDQIRRVVKRLVVVVWYWDIWPWHWAYWPHSQTPVKRWRFDDLVKLGSCGWCSKNSTRKAPAPESGKAWWKHLKKFQREFNFRDICKWLTILLNLTHVVLFWHETRCKQMHLRSDVIHLVIHFHHPRADQLKEFQGLNGGDWHVLGFWEVVTKHCQLRWALWQTCIWAPLSHLDGQCVSIQVYVDWVQAHQVSQVSSRHKFSNPSTNSIWDSSPVPSTSK